MTFTIDRKTALGFATGLAIGIAGTLLLAGGDDGPEERPIVETTETETSAANDSAEEEEDAAEGTAEGAVEVGVPVRSGGIEMTVTGARSESEITYTGGVSSSTTPNAKAKTVQAPQGGSYVFVESTITNDSSSGIDITCSFPIDAKVVDIEGRTYDPIESLDQIEGNPECNDLLQPGFDAPMSWIFLVPPDADIETFSFAEVPPNFAERPTAEVVLPELE